MLLENFFIFSDAFSNQVFIWFTAAAEGKGKSGEDFFQKVRKVFLILEYSWLEERFILSAQSNCLNFTCSSHCTDPVLNVLDT